MRPCGFPSRVAMDQPYLLLHLSKTCRVMLRCGQEISLGRAKTNGLIFEDPTLSRFHATINWSGRQPVITDCKSQAGIVVDNRKVDRKFLVSKHKILLGKTRLVAEYCRVKTPPEERTKPKISEGTPSAILEDYSNNSVIILSEKSRADEGGLLTNTKTFHKYLLQLEHNHRTGTLHLTDEETKRKARITLAGGKIIDARLGVLRDLHALVKIVDFSRISYDFVRKVEVGPRELSLCPTILIARIDRYRANLTRKT